MVSVTTPDVSTTVRCVGGVRTSAVSSRARWASSELSGARTADRRGPGPANLTFQWQRELNEKFGETFVVLKGATLRDQFGINHWQENPRVITSLDLAKRADIVAGLRQVKWDLAIVDEAHRMSATPNRKTERYVLGELLRDAADHLLLLTATPHKGDPVNFSLFLQLLDEDAYADVTSIKQAMERRRAPFYLRRTKEAMVHFPERMPDGTWQARKIFTKRIPHTADFQIDGREFELYRRVTAFVKSQSNRAAAQGDDPRAMAVGFLMAMYQRRLASSTYALRHSLDRRALRLAEGLKKAQDLARLAPPELPDPEDLEEMEEFERERLEQILEAITIASNPDAVRAEIGELKELAVEAQEIENTDVEAKLSRLKVLLHEQGFFDDPGQRLLLFTEFKDTLDYLVGKLKSWGFKVGFIHGGMKPGNRDQPGTRLYAEQQFQEGAIQVLVATEAAGEGINLQRCNILFNYDIPGTRTASSSGWAGSTAMARPRTASSSTSWRRTPSKARCCRSCTNDCRRFVTRLTTMPCSTSSERFCQPRRSSEYCAITTPGRSARATSRTACCVM